MCNCPPEVAEGFCRSRRRKKGSMGTRGKLNSDGMLPNRSWWESTNWPNLEEVEYLWDWCNGLVLLRVYLATNEILKFLIPGRRDIFTPSDATRLSPLAVRTLTDKHDYITVIGSPNLSDYPVLILISLLCTPILQNEKIRLPGLVTASTTGTRGHRVENSSA